MSSPRAALLALLAVLCLASPAGAAFSGSNGKVAWVTDSGSLVVDDPFDDVTDPRPLAQATTIDSQRPRAAVRAAVVPRRHAGSPTPPRSTTASSPR